MGNAVLYMSMSVDGFIAGPDERPGVGLGEMAGSACTTGRSRTPTRLSRTPSRN